MGLAEVDGAGLGLAGLGWVGRAVQVGSKNRLGLAALGSARLGSTKVRLGWDRVGCACLVLFCSWQER